MRFWSQVRRLPPRDVLTGLQRTATYTRNVWVRLNGGRVPGGGGAVRLPDGLPVPTSTKVHALSRKSLRFPNGCSRCLAAALPSCHTDHSGGPTHDTWSWTSLRGALPLRCFGQCGSHGFELQRPAGARALWS
jgi:hypothetical protein